MVFVDIVCDVFRTPAFGTKLQVGGGPSLPDIAERTTESSWTDLFLSERPREAVLVARLPVVEARFGLVDGQVLGLDLLHDVDQLALTARHPATAAAAAAAADR